MTLTEQLAAYSENSSKEIPPEIYKVMQDNTASLISDHLAQKAIKVGDSLPSFELPDIHGNTKSSAEILTSKYSIISFYRGGWCPYCNMELRALQQHLDEFKNLGAYQIAISPETPNNSLSTSEKNELNFDVLSDIDNAYASSLGLVFKLPDELDKIYKSFNIHVDAHNGNSKNELPMPATLIVDEKQKVVFRFINEDYTKRLDPSDILSFLR